MQRTLPAVLLALLALAAGAWFLLRSDAPPPAPTDVGQISGGTESAGPVAVTGDGAAGSASGTTERRAVALGRDGLLGDPEIQAGLTGFRGRIVDHAKVPVADCGVRIYRFAQDTVLPEGVDLFAEEPTIEPQYVAGEARTQSDGRFEITGVWPRAFYMLFGGIDTDSPTRQLITRTPSPGEIVDLGDIVLPHAGVIVGTIVDEDGEALPGALVRAVDLPGTVVSFFPVERFDPEGAILVREPAAPMRVVEMPKWAKRAFDELPIPTTTSGADGSFRLVGVVPGSNFFAVTARGFLSETRPSVVVRAGQERNVGEIRVKRGEELIGKVVDAKGEPVEGAEVFAGATLSAVPFDLATRVGTSDAEGKFQAEGFAPGKVTVAARRGRGQPWILAEPQPVMSDVVVTLPALLGVVADVRLGDGEPAANARLRLLQGRAGEGAAELAVMGMVPPVDLRDRVEPTKDGKWQIKNLLPGRYTLLAEAPGHAVAFAPFEIVDADATVSVQLVAKREFTVAVVGPDGKPIRNAAIYAVGRGKGKVFDMPIHCGRTGEDGRLVVGKIDAETARVSADHPKWGLVHGEVNWGEELVLRMSAPGELRGQVLMNGKPPPLGEFTATLEFRSNGPRGAIEDMPMLQNVAGDGTFGAKALQPGQYRVGLVKALDSLRSPGGVFALAQDMFLANRLPRETAQIASGQVTEVKLEAGEKPIDGPTASLSGSVTVNGRVGEGYAVVVSRNGERFTARSDARGQFVLQTVPAGKLDVALLPPATEGFMARPGSSLWETQLDLASAETKVLDIDLNTGSIAGVVTDNTGAPVSGAAVFAELQSKENSRTRQFTVADAQGEFRLAPVVEGTWSLTASARGEGAGRAQLPGVQVGAGATVAGLRLQLIPAVRCEGRVDLSSFGAEKPRWAWLAFHRPPTDGQGEVGQQVSGVGISIEDGRFSTTELEAGIYRVRLWGGFERGTNKTWYCGELVVPAAGVKDVLLRPLAESSAQIR